MIHLPAKIESLVPSLNSDWSTFHRLATLGRRFAHGEVACRLMSGLILLDLRERHKAEHGHGTWEETLLKFGAPLKRRYLYETLQMAELAKPRLKMGDPSGVFRQLLEAPLDQLTEPQVKALHDACAELVDGQGQLEFMASLGLTKPRSQGDAVWTKFCRERHPELLGTKRPRRNAVGPIAEEFRAWELDKLKPKRPSAAQIREAALGLMWEIENVLESALRNKVLAVLEPEEFVPLLDLFKAATARCERLADPGRNKVGRPRKKTKE